MIILRYLTREILLTTAAISFCLFLLFFGQRFTQYLDQAANGELAPAAILIILAYRIPDILVLILPVAYFLSILIAYGRLYSDNEMVVLSSGGVSPARLLVNTLLSALIMAVVVGTLSLYVTPYTVNKVEEIKSQQANRSLLELLHPGRFEQFNPEDPTTYYFERAREGGRVIEKVLVANVNADPEREGVASLITAESAREVVDSPSGNRYLALGNGHQYLGKAGELDYQVSHFRSAGSLMEQAEEEEYRKYFERQTTAFLWRRRGSKLIEAELQWRLATPLLVVVLSLIAVPLSHTGPRQGRYAKIFPAFIPTVLYLGLLIVAKDNVQDGKLNPKIGLWWVHGLFLFSALCLLFWNNGRPKGKWRRITRSQSIDTNEAKS